MTTTTLHHCPEPECDVFPFDSAEDLAEHVRSGGHTSAATRRPSTGARWEAPLRSFTPGAKPARHSGHSSAPARQGEEATEKQLAFIVKLAAERNVDVDVAGTLAVTLDRLTKKQASDVIEVLLAAPKAAPASEVKTKTAGPAPEGLHVFEGTVYKVQTSKTSGKRYAKELRDGAWEYVGQAPMRNLSEATMMTLEQAQEYGRRTGVCCSCGRELTKQESIEAGIGPICAAKF